MVTLDSIKEIFSNIRKDNAFDLNSELRWGFFFSSEKIEDLFEIYSKIEGLDFVQIYPNKGLYWLHFEKNEPMTEQSLFDLCQSFYDLVDEFNKSASANVVFDGWDVGK